MKEKPLQNQKCNIAVFIKDGVIITGEGRITGKRSADNKQAILEITLVKPLSDYGIK